MFNVVLNWDRKLHNFFFFLLLFLLLIFIEVDQCDALLGGGLGDHERFITVIIKVCITQGFKCRHLAAWVDWPQAPGHTDSVTEVAAFKSLCDADLDNDCDEPLVIADTPAKENITLVHLDDNEEVQEEEEEEEEIVELPVPVENHVVKHLGPPERKPPSNDTREEITPSEVKEKSPPIILNGGGNHEPNHHEVVKNSILTSQP